MSDRNADAARSGGGGTQAIHRDRLRPSPTIGRGGVRRRAPRAAAWRRRGGGGPRRHAASQDALRGAVGFVKGLGATAWELRHAATPSPSTYGTVGLVLALLILTIGLWDTIVIAVFVMVGAVIGQIRDGDNGIVNFFRRLSRAAGRLAPGTAPTGSARPRARRNRRGVAMAPWQKDTARERSRLRPRMRLLRRRPLRSRSRRRRIPRLPAAADAPESAAADEASDDEDDEEYEDTEDSLTYSNGVIEKIVAMATREVPHVLGMKGNLIHFVQETLGAKDLTKGVTVEVTDDNRVVVNISVIIEYGCYAPAIFEDVKERVTERLDRHDGPRGRRHQPAHRGRGDARGLQREQEAGGRRQRRRRTRRPSSPVASRRSGTVNCARIGDHVQDALAAPSKAQVRALSVCGLRWRARVRHI